MIPPSVRHFVIALVAMQFGCTSNEPSPSVDEPPPTLSDLPIEMTVKQRSTTVVPNSSDSLRLTVDDITGGQVMVSLAESTGNVVLDPASLSQGEAATFKLEAGPHRLELKELSNALVGEDFATFIISPSKEDGASETEKIEQLLAAVESAEGLVFIRNGVEYSAQDAANHLRSKWKAAGDGIKTAQQFIDKLGSKSSMSDRPYRVRLSDGTEILAGVWLRTELAKIEQPAGGQAAAK